MIEVKEQITYLIPETEEERSYLESIGLPKTVAYEAPDSKVKGIVARTLESA